MARDNGATRKAAGGNARPDGRVEPDPIPAELLADHLPGELWARAGVPPSGPWVLMGATETAVAWLVVCPACCQGWCRLLPSPGDSYDYILDIDQGCSCDCPPAEVAWWALWRAGEIPPPAPVPADERSRRYAAGALRRILDALPDRPSEHELNRAAFAAGHWLEAGALPTEPVAGTLLAAAARANLDFDTIASKLAAALTAGRARPGRLPR